MSEEPFAFSDAQQEAFIGHISTDRELWDYAHELGIDNAWFNSSANAELWNYISAFCRRNKRPPQSVDEVMSWVETEARGLGWQKAYVEAQAKRFKRCLEQAQKHSKDVLEKRLSDWRSSRVIATEITSMAGKFNAGHHKEAIDMVHDVSAKLLQIEVAGGKERDKLKSSGDRAYDERIERMHQSGKHLRYGISFLDDALHGIMLNDLIVLGARSGVGKTEAAKIVAEANVLSGKKVAFFALEAEPNEIERRIKHSLLVRAYRHKYRDHPNIMLPYATWRFGGLKELEEFDDGVSEWMKQKYNDLHTYYRSSGDFSRETLVRELARTHKEYDLVILDHIHYVDLPGSDSAENQEMSRLMKTARDTVLNNDVPMVLVAHLRKSAGMGNALVPDIDDFHGSSNIAKVATTAILMAKANEVATLDPRVAGGLPTLIRIAKNRLDGSRLVHVGMGFYNKEKGAYLDNYATGRLNLNATNWRPDSPDNVPYWATRGGVQVSEID